MGNDNAFLDGDFLSNFSCHTFLIRIFLSVLLVNCFSSFALFLAKIRTITLFKVH